MRYYRRYRPRRTIFKRRARTTGFRRFPYRRRYKPRMRSYPIRPIRSKWQAAILNRKLVKFRYIDSAFTMSLAVGNTYQDVYTFRGNGPYDPDSTGVGCQPYGFDNWAAFYAAINVAASKIKVYINLETSALDENLKLYLYPSASSSIVANHDPSDLHVVPYCRSKVINQDYLSKRKGNIISNYMTTRKIYPAISPKDNTWVGTFSAVPSTQWYWHFIADSSDIPLDITITFDVQITYYCILSSPVSLNES